MGVHHWSKVPEENQTSDPRGFVQANWSAKSMGPAVRGLMATAACARDDGLGTLLATVGANNVYRITTNEGLIDPATQINNLTPAITKEFLIRAVLPPLVAAVATSAPTIIIDSAAPVPLQRRDGSALKDGDLTGAPVEILGDTIVTGAYTRARILDLLPSDIAALAPPSLGYSIGGIMPFTGNNTPAGFLPAAGLALSRNDYAKLWAHAQASGMIVNDADWLGNGGALQGCYSTGDGATNFRIPHLGGVFLRGLDFGRGTDLNRVIGTMQADLIRKHTHPLTGEGYVTQLYGAGPSLGIVTSPDTSAGFHAVNIGETGGAETRPVNVAYPFLIRAY